MRAGVALVVAGACSGVVAGPRSAEACSCVGPDLGIVWPAPGGVLAPNSRVLMRVRAGEMPVMTASYLDASGGTIAGSFERLGAYLYEVWAFRPAVPFEGSRKLLLRYASGSMVQHVEVEVVPEPDTTPHRERGAMRVAAYETHFTPDSQPTSCDDEARNEPFGFDRIESVTSGFDGDGLPADVIQRMYVYRTPGDRPTQPDTVGVGRFAFRRTLCSANLCGHPSLLLDFSPGDTLCVRLEWEDPAGNRSGYEDEACTRVEHQLFWLDGFAGCRVPPGVDGGIFDTGASEPDSGPSRSDAGITANMDAAGSSVGGGRGCTCSTSADRGSPWLFFALVYGACAARRRRTVRRS